MKLGITVNINGQPTHVSTLPIDVVMWERETGKVVSDWATQSPAYTDIAWLAWHAMTRGDSNRPSFEEWLADGVEDITATEDEAEENPTHGAR